MSVNIFLDSQHGRGSSSNFTVELHPPLHLDKDVDYEVALVASDIWYSWYNIQYHTRKQFVQVLQRYRVEESQSTIGRLQHRRIGPRNQTDTKSERR